MNRVLVVTNDFPPRWGGIETFVRELCDELPADQVVVHTASMPGAAEHDAGLTFPVVRDPSRVLLPTPAVRRRVVATLQEHGCDRVLYGASVPLGLLAPALRKAGAGRQVALTHGHEVWWARLPGTRQALRRVGDEVDVTTYVSEWCHERIAPALTPAGRERMTRLSPGVDPRRFYPGCGGAGVRERIGLSPDAPVVVCTARLVPRKGQDTLIRAWPRVLRAHPGAALLLVGDGPDRRRLERLVQEHGVTSSVVMPGSVPWPDVPAWVDAGDVFAMPCRTRWGGLEPEAWGIVFVEAQACGLPVVVGDSGGAPETLAGPGAGRVVAGVDRTAEALVALLGERDATRPAVTPHTWEAAGLELRRLLS